MPRPTSRNHRVIVALLILVVYWGLLFVATHIPQLGTKLTVSDKAMHFAAYAGLSFLLAWVASVMRWRGVLVYCAVFIIAAAYGAVDEWLQSFVPNRHGDFADWLADIAGAAAGLAAFVLVRLIARRAAPEST